MTDRHATKKVLKITIICSVLLCLFGYAGYEVQKLAFGPRIDVLSPINGSLVSNSLTEIYGTAKNIKDISLDDRKIYIDEKGNFREKALLSYGYNVFSIKATDKFGRDTEKIIEIIYK